MQSSLLIINNALNRGDNLRIILEFLGYAVLTSDIETVNIDADLNAVNAVFVMNTDTANPFILKLREKGIELPVILVSDQHSENRFLNSETSSLINSVLTSPFSQSELLSTLQTTGVNQQTALHQRRSIELFRSLSGDSIAIQQTRQLIQQVADRDVTVLILGESGTGKEVVARNLHYYSSRRHQPFVPVNCGAIPGELLESELFGHEKGAFTGAFSARQGRFELAEGGTLFLDEIGDMPLAMQVKLLRVIQERTFERVGGNRTIHSDVRIIAATHQNLEQAIQEKTFREDLYYRLNVFPIDVPALRHRREDIPVLVADLTARLEREKNITIRFAKAAMQKLQGYNWPGNVRELANVVERMAILIPDGLVDIDDLPDKFPEHQQQMQSEHSQTMNSISHHPGGSGHQLPENGINLKEHLLDLEKHYITRALDECNGVVAQAARKLQLNRTTLVEKMRKFGLDKAEE
ncbi:MAG: sigma-54 dependent transcriptional regulator [Gammaproteobacteria bacterium]|nr:sigma-54 dependent transcriptional regulator [Gammaproteobacteria bacterium]